MDVRGKPVQRFPAQRLPRRALQTKTLCRVFWRRKWQPTPVFLPGEPHGQRSLVGYSPQGGRVILLHRCVHLVKIHPAAHSGPARFSVCAIYFKQKSAPPGQMAEDAKSFQSFTVTFLPSHHPECPLPPETLFLPGSAQGDPWQGHANSLTVS